MRTRFEPATSIDLALARGVIYRTLAIGLQRATEVNLARLRSDAAREALRAATQLLDRTQHATEALLPAALRVLDYDQLRTTDLDARYVRLFGHTARGLVCPCETEYGPGGGFQQPQQLADIAGYYRAFGLRLRPGDDQRVDHVACECEFMDFLCRKEAFSRQIQQAPGHTTTRLQQADTLEQTRKAQASFLRNHLGRFGMAFGHELVREDDDGFYAGLGHLLLRFLDLECRLLDVEAGPASLSVRLDQVDDVPMACGTGESLIQIHRREDYVESKL